MRIRGQFLELSLQPSSIHSPGQLIKICVLGTQKSAHLKCFLDDSGAESSYLKTSDGLSDISKAKSITEIPELKSYHSEVTQASPYLTNLVKGNIRSFIQVSTCSLNSPDHSWKPHKHTHTHTIKFLCSSSHFLHRRLLWTDTHSSFTSTCIKVAILAHLLSRRKKKSEAISLKNLKVGGPSNTHNFLTTWKTGKQKPMTTTTRKSGDPGVK